MNDSVLTNLLHSLCETPNDFVLLGIIGDCLLDMDHPAVTWWRKVEGLYWDSKHWAFLNSTTNFRGCLECHRPGSMDLIQRLDDIAGGRLFDPVKHDRILDGLLVLWAEGLDRSLRGILDLVLERLVVLEHPAAEWWHLVTGLRSDKDGWNIPLSKNFERQPLGWHRLCERLDELTVGGKKDQVYKSIEPRKPA